MKMALESVTVYSNFPATPKDFLSSGILIFNKAGPYFLNDTHRYCQFLIRNAWSLAEISPPLILRNDLHDLIFVNRTLASHGQHVQQKKY
jgi:hypothetical protein